MSFNGFEFLVIKTDGDNKNTFDVQASGSVAEQQQVTNHENRISSLESRVSSLESRVRSLASRK